MAWYSMNLQRRRGGVYYFRRAVPEDIQGTLGKREIVRSLRTKELLEAKKRAKQFGLEIDQEFDLARSRSGNELSVEEAQRLAERRYHEWLAGDAERRIENEKFPDTVEFDPDLLEEFAGDARRALANSDYKPVADTTLEFLKEAGLEPDRGSLSFKRLAFCLLRYRVRYYERVDERNAGVWHESEPVYMGGYVPRPTDFPRAAPTHTPVASPLSPTQPETKTPLLSEVLEKWLGERKPSDKTERDWRTAVRRFTELRAISPSTRLGNSTSGRSRMPWSSCRRT